MQPHTPTQQQGSQDPEAIRKKVLADPNTEQIARNLGVPLDEYVEQVVHFVLNPHAEPSLYIVEDEDLRSLGLEPPSEEAMGRFIMEAVSVAEAAGKTEFVDERKELVTLGDQRPSATEAGAPADSELASEMERTVRASRGTQG